MKNGLWHDRMETGQQNYAFDVDAAQKGQPTAISFDPVDPVATLMLSGR